MKILLADDDSLVLNALQTILTKSGYEVQGAYTNPLELLEEYNKNKSDIVILDIRMKELNGVDIAIDILKNDKDAKIILLTTFNDKQDIFRGLKSGVLGVVLKDNIVSLTPAIESVYLGNKIIDTQIDLEGAISNSKKEIELLTKKENEILEKVAEGLSNKEIAKELYLSDGTVRNYISVILEKLDLRDRTQLAIYYYKNK